METSVGLIVFWFFFFPKEGKNVKISVLAGVDEKAAEGH